MAHTKRLVRRVLVEVLESKEATVDQRIKAARLLTKLGPQPGRAILAAVMRKKN